VKTLKSLRILVISNCQNLQHLPPLNELVALEVIDVRNCAQLEELPPLDHLTALRHLMLKGCEKLSKGCLKLHSHHGHRVVA
jgi:hypothetical protein